MSVAFQEPLTRKAEFVKCRTDDIAEDLNALVATRAQHVREVQAVIYDCAGLAAQWRAIVERFGTAAESGVCIDYREIGEILRPASRRTLEIYERVLEMATSLDQAGYQLQKADLELAVWEAKNVVNWIDSWPSHDLQPRALARQAAEAGDFCCDADFHG